MPNAATTTLARDRGRVWHPYTSIDAAVPYEVTAAEGIRLRLRDGAGAEHEVIDAMSSWWSTIHGYRHPRLDAAAHGQIDRFSHVMFGGLTHSPAVELAEKLVACTADPLQHVFFADSGSVAVEVALKLAVQYQRAMGRPERHRFVALRGGYHGDTAGAMSVCDPVDGMHAAFAGHLAPQLFLPRPPAARLTDGELRADADAVGVWISAAEQLLAERSDVIAGIIIEPVLQGAGGMHVYAPECIRALRRLADEHGMLLIADEIATGFGRTGRDFACEWAGIVPDILCVGKALTGGYLSLAAMICTTEVAHGIRRHDDGALLHGPTFMANPLACAIAGASLDLLGEQGSARVDTIEAALRRSLAPARALDVVTDVRTLGAVGVVQLNEPVNVPAVTAAALARGVWVRPFRDLVYTMPPYVCTAADAETIGHAIVGAVTEVHGA